MTQEKITSLPCSLTTDFSAIAKSIDPGQPARPAKADLGRNCSLSAAFQMALHLMLQFIVSFFFSLTTEDSHRGRIYSNHDLDNNCEGRQPVPWKEY